MTYYNYHYKKKGFIAIGNIQYYLLIILQKSLFFICLILAISLLIFSKNNKNFDIEARKIISDITFPLMQVIEYPINISASLFLNFRDLINVKTENKTLKQKILDLEKIQLKSLNIFAENTRLKKILNFVNYLGIVKYKTAKILYKNRGSLTKELIIKIGLFDDIQEGSVVLGTYGVVGRIVNITNDFSQVLLLTDSKSKIPVFISESEVKGILTGNNSQYPEILYLDEDHNIIKGDKVFTSGDGDLLLSGLFIGTVHEVEEKSVKIKLIENIKKIDIVTILDVRQEESKEEKSKEGE